MEAFLASGVPELHAQTFAVDVDRFGDEVYSHGGLGLYQRTCSLPVKLSKMKRLMMEVLPTDWSPSSTILHFTAGLFYIQISYFILKTIRTYYRCAEASLAGFTDG